MSNYVPWYGKKQARLARHERTFFELLRAGTDPKQLKEAAETLRLARVRALSARRAQLPPFERSATAGANLDRDIECWQSLTPDQIIEGYRNGWKAASRRWSRLFLSSLSVIVRKGITYQATPVRWRITSELARRGRVSTASSENPAAAVVTANPVRYRLVNL